MLQPQDANGDKETASETTSLIRSHAVDSGFGAPNAHQNEKNDNNAANCDKDTSDNKSTAPSSLTARNNSKSFCIATETSPTLSSSHDADAIQCGFVSSTCVSEVNGPPETKWSLPSKIHKSFLQTSLLYSINHGALLSCLGLANARLGNTVASTSSSILYACYTGFALLGATYVVKKCGAVKGLVLAMSLIAMYVASFWWIVVFCYTGAEDVGDGFDSVTGDELGGDYQDEDKLKAVHFEEENGQCSQFVATLGGILGGIGSAILWTAQGTFFSRTSFRYARLLQELKEDGALPIISVEKVTSRLGGEWAFVFLFVEVWMRVLSTVLVRKEKSDMGWQIVFGVYTALAAGSIIALRWVEFNEEDVEQNEKTIQSNEIINGEKRGNTLVSITAGDGDENAVTEMPRIKVELRHTAVQDVESLNKKESNNKSVDSQLGHHFHASSADISSQKSPFRKAVAAIDLLVHDPKMKYLSFLNITFGLCTAFTSSVVNGQVIRVALNDDNSMYVGIFTAITSCVAAVLSLAVGMLEWISSPPKQSATSQNNRQSPATPVSLLSTSKQFLCGALTKDAVITIGSLSYLLIALLFLIYPSFVSWDVPSLVLIYVLLGIGRSSYEGALRAIFADFFPYEKEGAFANIILFNGLSSMVGYWLNVVSSDCSVSTINEGIGASDINPERGDLYCVQYHDGSVHNVLFTEAMVIVSALLGIWGFWKAKALYLQE